MSNFVDPAINFLLQGLSGRGLVDITIRLRKSAQEKNSNGVKSYDQGGEFKSPKLEIKRPGNDPLIELFRSA